MSLSRRVKNQNASASTASSAHGGRTAGSNTSGFESMYTERRTWKKGVARSLMPCARDGGGGMI
jgi:hypothetical protein